MVEVELVGVRVDAPSSMVLLRESAGARRVLPIMIGPAEATAIQFALNGVVTPRPMSHDLMKTLLEDFKVQVDEIVVTELRDRTFFAELRMTGPAGTHSVSCRPSDALALALRTGTKLYVEEAVLDEAGIVEDEKPANADEMVEQFRHFIDNVNPEDFAS